MKTKISVVSTLLFCSSLCMNAATGIASNTEFGTGEDSIRCIQNISLFTPYARSGNYAEALKPWEESYAECPAANRNIYIQGTKIVKWQIEKEKDPAKRTALIEKLMRVYSDYDKYFGHRTDFPTGKILSAQAVDYAAVTGEKMDIERLYPIIQKSVEELKETSNPQVIFLYMQAANTRFKAEKMPQQEYIQTYLAIDNYLKGYMETAEGQMLDYAKQVSDAVGSIIAQSGAADCSTLQKLFGARVEENKTDIEFLKKTISLLRRVGCQEEEVYFSASAYAHKIEPTFESAVGMAKQALKKEEYSAAIRLFEEATTLSSDPKEQADMQYTIALLYSKIRNNPAARRAALRSAELNPKAAPYILIAQLYAGDARSIYPDDSTLAACVYYAAIEMLDKANAIDPSSDAASLRAQYRRYLPSQQEIFMNPDLAAGKQITIGGWIQERITIR